MRLPYARAIWLVAPCVMAACAVSPASESSYEDAPDGGRASGRDAASRGTSPREEETPTRDPGPGPGPDLDAGDAAPAVAACTDSGLADVSLRARGAVATRPLTFVGALPTFRPSSTCPAEDVFSTTARPYTALIVRNDSGAPASLSAWAVCGAGTDAFMAFYRRKAPPTTETERRECALGTVISNGYSAALGDHTSPDTHASTLDAGATSYCPGLLRSRNVGLFLEPCETAVLWVQPYYATDDTAHPPPSAVRFRLD